MSDPARELDAALRGVALADLTDWSRMIGSGPDLLDLLHRLTTGDLRALAPGEGRPAVLTTAKGRIVERLSIHHLGPEGVLILSGPGSADRVLDHLKRFTFAEQTGLRDVGQETCAFAFVGPRWEEAGAACGFGALPPYGAVTANVATARVHLLRTNGFDAQGIIVVGASTAHASIRAALVGAFGNLPGGTIGPEAFESWRVVSGHPLSGRELTGDYNPLEAGLNDAVSFTKGCYVGQEVVARLNTYDKVARRIVRLEFPPGRPAPPPGARVLAGDREIGAITSALLPPGRDRAVALAYVKLRDIPEGAQGLAVDGASGRVEVRIVTD